MMKMTNQPTLMTLLTMGTERTCSCVSITLPASS
jgi:hypothetical protein